MKQPPPLDSLSRRSQSIVASMIMCALLGCSIPLIGCGSSTESPDQIESTQHRHATTAGDAWLTSYDEALAEAQARDLPLLIDFSGLEWCEPCRTLRADVFESKAFGQWAHDRCVLLEIDVPGPGKPRDVATAELIDRYSVTTYPTVLFVAPNGDVIGRIPVALKELEAWLDAANTILSK